MFLKRLVIQSKSEVIRDISFHKGINFIVDETPENYTQQTTGNNVGKTTVLRLVDYCFGGDGKNIYKDTEFPTQPNTTVENFLKEKNVTVSIELADDIENTKKTVAINRNFLSRGKKVQEINDMSVIDDFEFDKKLKEEIFATQVEKPTFRQIISKNIREETNKMSHIVKVLNPYTKKEEYEALYLFWLGISTNEQDEKQKLSLEKTKEENFQKRLKKEGELSLIEQQLLLVNVKIEELAVQKNTFGLNEYYYEDVEKLNQIKHDLNQTASYLSSLEMRRDLILESKNELENEYARIKPVQIRELYEKAKRLVPNLQKSFEDTVKFHNDLIDEKLKYILKELPNIQKTINGAKTKISELSRLEKELTNKLQKSGLTEELGKVIDNLNEFFEKKGEFEERKRLWEKSNENLEQIVKNLDNINKGILSNHRLIQDRITVFNRFFSEISNELYGESYILSSTTDDKGYDLIVTNFEGNPSTGKKKGQIAAFDFAYVQFADYSDIPCLHFIMHDQLENIHDNQLNTLVMAANQINGQYIVPILRDKIPADIDVEQYVVLSLSQDCKLFKIQ
jgi:uncharacterized protein YydD (DUF2326 family)